jgi:hypothetical protein
MSKGSGTLFGRFRRLGQKSSASEKQVLCRQIEREPPHGACDGFASSRPPAPVFRLPSPGRPFGIIVLGHSFAAPAALRCRAHRTRLADPAETAIFEAIATLNGIEPFAWLTDVLERVISGRTKAHELERLLPWHWKAKRLAAAAVGT